MAKKLGQYFLKNKSAINKIISSLELKKGDAIIEIGPGKGALTFPLAKKCDAFGCSIIAIEKDPKFFTKNLNHESLKNVKFIKGDVLNELEYIARNLQNKKYKLVGNIPYYITGRLMRILSEIKYKPEVIVLTMQKEVAEKITSVPPKMNLLSAITNFWAASKIIANIKSGSFSPSPKVDSAIIKLIPKTNQKYNIQNAEYYKFAKICFKQPRKTILNNLRQGLNLKTEEILKILKINKLTGKKRAQSLDFKIIIKLSCAFKSLEG